MEFDPARYMTNLRGFARAIGYQMPRGGEEARLFAAIHRSRIGTVNLDPKAIATLLLWQAACHQKDSTIVVVPRPELGACYIELAENMIADVSEMLRDIVWVLNDRSGLCLPGGGRAPVKVCYPQVLDMERLQLLQKDRVEGRLVVIVPDIDRIPGCYLQAAAAMSKIENVTVVFNAVRR